MINGKVYAGLNEGERALVDWQYTNTGCFSNHLMDLIAKSDSFNRARLAEGFPLHVQAYNRYTSVTGWWPKLQEQLLKPVLYAVED